MAEVRPLGLQSLLSKSCFPWCLSSLPFTAADHNSRLTCLLVMQRVKLCAPMFADMSDNSVLQACMPFAHTCVTQA